MPVDTWHGMENTVPVRAMPLRFEGQDDGKMPALTFTSLESEISRFGPITRCAPMANPMKDKKLGRVALAYVAGNVAVEHA